MLTITTETKGITIEPISEDNFVKVLRLKASEDLVATNAESIAEAYLSLLNMIEHKRVDEYIMEQPFAIEYDGEPVGFLMIAYEDGEDMEAGENIYWLSRFMIDESHQGKGYGKAAILQLIEYLKTKPNGNAARLFYTSVVPGDVGALGFYKKVGFEETGQDNYGEAVIRMELW